MNSAIHQPVAFEAPQSLGEHLLRNAADLTLQLGIPHGALSQDLNDQGCPLVRDSVKHQTGRALRVHH